MIETPQRNLWRNVTHGVQDKLNLLKKRRAHNLRRGIREKTEMGNWSPFSEEWEKQQIKKMIEKSETSRLAFEKKPWIYKAIVRLLKTIQYYLSLMAIHIRMTFDRKYREEVNHAVDGLEEKTLRAIADMMNDDKKDSRE